MKYLRCTRCQRRRAIEDFSRIGIDYRICLRCVAKENIKVDTVDTYKELHGGCVYFIEGVGTGLIKIGYTGTAIEKRLSALQGSSPVEVKLIKIIKGTYKDEKEFHNKFSHLRHHFEWYEYKDDLLEFVKNVI